MVPNTTDDLQRAWLRKLPKCELHVHLEGTIEPRTLVKLSQRHDAAPLSLQDAESLYKYEDFLGFLRAFGQVTLRLQSAEDYELITFDMIKTLAAQGVDHAEVYISFGQILRYKAVTLEDAMAAAERGRLRAELEFGTTVYWVVDAIRQNGPGEFSIVLQKTLALRTSYASIVGIGIGGNEASGPVTGFADLFGQAKNAGLHVKAHAGEAVPSFSIWDALAAGAERIGHGLTAASDAALIEVLKERQTPLEVCPTSNIRTGCCRSIEEHPIRSYIDAGLLVTLNSDDPPMFETSLLDEYELVQRELALSNDDMVQLARNSIVSSWLPAARKEGLLAELQNFRERSS